MPRRKEDVAYLWDMLSAGKEVMSFVAGKKWHDYERSVGLRRQVERSIELVGEAAKHVSEEFRSTHPHIPWTKIVRQRHRLAHDYDILDNAVIWRVATVYVPEMVNQIEQILPTPPSDPIPE